MSEFHEHYKSPMEDVFLWNTSAGHSAVKKGETSTESNSSNHKRRCDEDDSGYATPSHSFSKSRLMDTPMLVVSEFPLPHTAPAEVKRRSKMSMSVEALNELTAEPSLYTEPMDVSPPEPSSSSYFSPHAQVKTLCPCNENIVDLEQSSTSYLPGLMTLETPRSSRRSSPIKCLNFSLSPVKRATQRHRFLNGFEHLDILYFLGVKMHFPDIVDKILSHLSGEDLSSVRLVSKSWKEVADNTRTAKNVWLQHVGHVMINKENIGSGGWSSSKGGTPLVVFNHSTPFHERQPRTPPSSPSKFNLFRMAAQELRHNQNLMHCPRCRGPSACTPDERLGECFSPVCLYRFCSVCKRLPHVGSCPDLFPSSPPNTPPKRMPSVCSKRSRRNLRRL